MSNYTEVADLQHFVLEESYVLDVEAHPGRLVMVMDLVLTPEHADFAPPVEGESYTFRKGIIEFGGVSSVTWTDQPDRPAVDADGETDGETDYGWIDSFDSIEDMYRLQGDFGTVELRASLLIVRLL